MSSISLQSCYSCNKTISPKVEGNSKFPCPNCGALIIRCSDCRRSSNNYSCTGTGCDFTGP